MVHIKYNKDAYPDLETVLKVAGRTMEIIEEHGLPPHHWPAVASMILIRSTRGLPMANRRFIFERFHEHLMEMNAKYATPEEADNLAETIIL